MSATTRRGFVAGAIASAAAPALAQAAPAPAPGAPQAKQKIVRRGRAIAVSPDARRLVVAHDHRRTIAIVRRGRKARRLVDVGGQPLELDISPDGRLAAVTTASWDEPGVALVDLRAGRVLGRAAVGPAPFDVAFAAGGRRLVVSGGEQEGTVHVLETRTLRVLEEGTLGRVPRGLAPARDGRHVWIALNGLDRIAKVDLETARTVRTLRTPRLPERLAVSGDRKRLLVAHGGRNAEHVSEIDLATGKLRWRRVGRQPAAVGWSRGRGVVALAGTGEVVVLGKSGKPRRRAVGGAPRSLAVAGGYAWTVDQLTGAIDRVRV
jgi:DNA-binding beta-propeller fold protein YncE